MAFIFYLDSVGSCLYSECVNSSIAALAGFINPISAINVSPENEKKSLLQLSCDLSACGILFIVARLFIFQGGACFSHLSRRER